MGEEQTADDLCLLHKGLAEFLIFEGVMLFQVWVFQNHSIKHKVMGSMSEPRK